MMVIVVIGDGSDDNSGGDGWRNHTIDTGNIDGRVSGDRKGV